MSCFHWEPRKEHKLVSFLGPGSRADSTMLRERACPHPTHDSVQCDLERPVVGIWPWRHSVSQQRWEWGGALWDGGGALLKRRATWDGAPAPVRLEGKQKGRFLHPCCREQKVIGTLWEQRALSKPMRTLRGNGGKPSVQCAQGWKPSDFSDGGLDLRKQNSNNKTAPVLTHGLLWLRDC